MADIQSGPSRGKRIVTLVALGIAFVILMALGTWQVERLQWKEALIATIEARRTAPPVTAAEIEAKALAGEDVDYRAVTLSGRFDHAHERYFLSTRDGEQGFYVYTPLLLADGKAVFVNRGFVPDELKDPAKRASGQIGGEVAITGLARAKLAQKPSFMVPDNEPARNMFFWKDMDSMAAGTAIDKTKLLPFFVDADATPNPGGYPIGGVTQIDLPNNHLGYAVTWYGLAAAMVVIAVLAFRRKAR